MKSIINFYKELDTFNIILFWGIIIVIILLLIFSIILLNKNKKLKQIINNNHQNTSNKSNDFEDIPVIDKDINSNTIEINKDVESNTIEDTPTLVIEQNTEEELNENIREQKVPEENNFVAEEHVKEYNKELFPLPNIEKVNNEKEIIKKPEPVSIPTGPYQRNVLREMSLNQTSPIGIVKRKEDDEKNIINAKELNQSLQNDTKEEKNTQEKYLYEVSKKLNEANNNFDIDRTEYEIKQEEEAIISYQELMAKKDSITPVDEEDAIISIEELINRKNKQEKLYNITENEEDKTFIDELKQFRHDL